jgi:hypothetical protein
MHNQEFFTGVGESFLWFGTFGGYDLCFFNPVIMFFSNYLLYKSSDHPLLYRLKRDHPNINAYLSGLLFIVSTPAIY